MKTYELIVLFLIIAPQVLVLGGSICLAWTNYNSSSNNSEES